MSFSHNGLNAKVISQTISIFISRDDPLMLLAELIDWNIVSEMALPNLKATTRLGYWMLGRALYLRPHLSVMILQLLFKMTDRGVEEAVKQTPVYQAFCGLGIMEKWHCPDHTKIEDFRNRLSPETHKEITDYILKIAVECGFANPSIVDIDSTVQEANLSYPSDATLMKKLTLKCKRTLDYLIEKKKKYLPEGISIDTKAILKKSQEYFFLAKNSAKEKKREIFAEYHCLVKKELKDFINFAEKISPCALRNLPWNHQVNIKQIQKDAWRYLLDVAHFVRNHTMKPGKILSFTMKDVICIKKGKAGKDKEFGRAFQVGRIEGNFLVPYTCSSLHMNDKQTLVAILKEHQDIFGKKILKSVTTDKGYYSQNNINFVKEITGDADGMQRPANIKNQVVGPQKEELYNRRSGVEPIIGHAKQFGLGQSKMKSDKATLASGYRSIMGFNLHQLMRNIKGEVK